jgi:hypothetical protein
MDNEVEIMRNETVMAKFEIIVPHLPGKPARTSVIIVRALAEIVTRDLTLPLAYNMTRSQII